MTSYIQRDAGGWHVVWYEDDDNDSGDGNNAIMAKWYAHRGEGGEQACIKRGAQPPPPREDFVPLDERARQSR